MPWTSFNFGQRSGARMKMRALHVSANTGMTLVSQWEVEIFLCPKRELECIWGVPKMEVPKKWMFYNGTSHLEMDDDWGYPYDSGNLHILNCGHWLQWFPSTLIWAIGPAPGEWGVDLRPFHHGLEFGLPLLAGHRQSGPVQWSTDVNRSTSLVPQTKTMPQTKTHRLLVEQ